MGKYFTIDELTRSNVAKANGIDNTPPADIVRKLNYLINHLLDPLRLKWGAPILVTSGYRCEALNEAVKGVTDSQHMKGEAADITLRDKAKNKQLFDFIRQSGLPFDQLIDESGYSWIHVSLREFGSRREILHLKG